MGYSLPNHDAKGWKGQTEKENKENLKGKLHQKGLEQKNKNSKEQSK